MLKRLKKQGFTLVELLVTIVLLGIVAAIVIYNMTSVNKTSKESDYERYIAAVKSAADVYATNNPEAFNDLYVSKAYVYLTIGDLVRSGLLDENLENPYTNEKIDFNEKIKANLDTTSGDIKFEYPLDNNEEETFLVTISDYVVWGETYDCMRGAGTYQLSLSDENGDLIMLDSQETIDKYNFKCALPEHFNDPDDDDTHKWPRFQAGNYEVEYTWITESGTKKSATRTLRVLPKVQPTFRTNYDYSFSEVSADSEWFTPGLLGSGDKQDPNCPNGWRCLTYTPYIEGADPESTTLKITKTGLNPKKTDEQNVTNGFISSYDTYRVDDGEKLYVLTTMVKGHYDNDYSYEAVGKAVMKMKLIIPPSYIKPKNENWVTQNKFEITDTYSPVGLDKYEYVLLKDGETPNDKNEDNIFDRTGNPTPKDVDLLNGVCTNSERSYPKIAFRAINKEGFVGDWVEVDAKLTNSISKLITASSANCTDSSKCCLKDGSSCYYTEKVVYLKYGNMKLVVLEKYDNDEILTTNDEIVTKPGDEVVQQPFSPNELTKGKWSIDVCDGTYSAHFNYATPSLEKIITEGVKITQLLPHGPKETDPNSYENIVKPENWAVGKQDKSNLGKITCFEFRGKKYCQRYNSATSIASSYNSYIGNLNLEMINRYKNAVRDSHVYWTTDTYGYNTFEKISEKNGKKASHVGEGTNVWNSYFYAYVNGKKTTAYSGQKAYLKPLIKFNSNSILACKGNGTSASPYEISARK